MQRTRRDPAVSQAAARGRSAGTPRGAPGQAIVAGRIGTGARPVAGAQRTITPRNHLHEAHRARRRVGRRIAADCRLAAAFYSHHGGNPCVWNAEAVRCRADVGLPNRDRFAPAGARRGSACVHARGPSSGATSAAGKQDLRSRSRSAGASRTLHDPQRRHAAHRGSAPVPAGCADLDRRRAPRRCGTWTRRAYSRPGAEQQDGQKRKRVRPGYDVRPTGTLSIATRPTAIWCSLGSSPAPARGGPRTRRQRFPTTAPSTCALNDPAAGAMVLIDPRVQSHGKLTRHGLLPAPPRATMRSSVTLQPSGSHARYGDRGRL